MDANIVTFSQFAQLRRIKASAVTELRKADRLVLTPDGKRVLVAESLRRIQETADPSKVGVVARHAAARGDVDGEGVGAATSTEEAAADAQDGGDGEISGYQASRARREHFLALSAQRDYEREIGKLMDADEVVAAVASATAGLRKALERLPDVLGPQLAAISDEGQVRALLAETIEHELEELGRQFGIASRREAA